MPTSRTRPLTASTGAPAALAPGLDLGDLATDRPDANQVSRNQRFAEGLRNLRVGAGQLALREHTLMVVGGILAPLGLIVILFGWFGAARTALVFEQVPYLISGGLLGVGLVVIGSSMYFAHWVTQQIRESRAQHAALLEAVQGLREELGRVVEALPPTGSVSDGDVWWATPHGTLAHRAGCAVIAGKDDVRPVPADEVVARCRLCAPELVTS